MLNAMSRYLDVLCFPTLFPSSKFGEHHSSQKITKSRLMNKDRRFRKEDQVCIYLLWQKEMHKIAAGVYNFLKGTHQHALPVGELMDRVSMSDDDVKRI